MKKILAIALALVMMLAVCVPAFAADKVISNTAPDAQTTIVKTSKTTEGGDDAAYYKITIPAEVQIPWSKVDQAFTYKIESQLELGQKLNIKVAGANKLTNASTTAYEIPYTVSEDEFTDAGYTTATEIVAADTARSFTLAITDAAWKAVPVAEYQDTLTFTVAVVPAPVAP